MNDRCNAAALMIILTIAALILVTTAPLAWMSPIFLTIVVCSAFLKVRWRVVIPRLVVVFLFAAVMAAGAAWTRPEQTGRPAAEAIFRAVFAGFVLIAFGAAMRTSDMFRGLRALRVPSLLTSSLALMLRSIDVLGDERKALLRSRAARGSTPLTWWAEWCVRVSLVSQLLMRAIQRSERVHRAMKARGWAVGSGSG